MDGAALPGGTGGDKGLTREERKIRSVMLQFERMAKRDNGKVAPREERKRPLTSSSADKGRDRKRHRPSGGEGGASPRPGGGASPPSGGLVGAGEPKLEPLPPMALVGGLAEGLASAASAPEALAVSALLAVSPPAAQW